jgi:hypothetical protein
LFLAAHGLGETSEHSPATTVIAARSEQDQSKALRLARVDGLAAINALPDGSVLTFDPKLTVVYGRNGAGKSGFARLFANACFSRHKPQIVPNIYADGRPAKPAADFHVLVDGGAQDTLEFGIGKDHPDLRRISFFDITIARLHVSETTAFEFKPSGFDVFPETARVYAELGKLLAASIQSRTHPTRFSESSIGQETEVSKLVATIGAKTDMAPIRKLAVHGDAEKSRLQQVDAQATALKASSPQQLITTLKQARSAITTLIGKHPLFRREDGTSDRPFKDRKRARSCCSTSRNRNV